MYVLPDHNFRENKRLAQVHDIDIVIQTTLSYDQYHPSLTNVCKERTQKDSPDTTSILRMC